MRLETFLGVFVYGTSSAVSNSIFGYNLCFDSLTLLHTTEQ